MSKNKLEWQEELTKMTKHLVGKTITAVEWLDDESMEATQWDERPVMLVLDDGSILVPQRDAEGNGAGVLTHHSALPPEFTLLHTI